MIASRKRVPVMRRSRSNAAELICQPNPSRTRSTAAPPRARPRVGWITLSAMSVRQRDRRETREQAELPYNAWVARYGRDRDADPDRPCSEDWREEQLGKQIRACRSAGAMPRVCEQLHTGEEEGEDRIGDRERRDECRQRLAQQELLAADRRPEDGRPWPAAYGVAGYSSWSRSVLPAWPGSGPGIAGLWAAPSPASRARTSPMAGSPVAGSGSGRCAWMW